MLEENEHQQTQVDQGGYFDLFGDPITDPQLTPEYAKKIPFTDEDVDDFLHEAVPKLMEDLIDCLHSTKKFRELKKECPSTLVTESTRRLWENLSWVYELSETAAVLPFDKVCAIESTDSEMFRTNISNHFKEEIKAFYAAYSSSDPVDAVRVAKKLGRYICVT